MFLVRLTDNLKMFTFETILISIPLTLITLFFLNEKKQINAIKLLSNIVAGSILIISLIIWLHMSGKFTEIFRMEYYGIWEWEDLFYSINFTSSYPINFSLTFDLDILSIKFIVLTAALTYLCILYVTQYSDLQIIKLNYICLFLIEFFLFLIFSAKDIFLFYIMYEAILIPMYLIIGIWGSRERKIRAVFLFFFYTLVGSILFLCSLLYIYTSYGTFDIEYLTAIQFSEEEQVILFLCFFLSFASKIPMFPLHIWLPEAHVEAPTVGSVLLAGILLKLGVYGFLRFNIIFFPSGSMFFSPIVQSLALIGIIYASLCAIRQTDLKRIIAYSSIAHMNLVVLGIFSFNLFGYEGSVFQSISHGLVSGGLFFLIGMIYYRYHTRFLYYYGGIVHFMPIFAVIFLILSLANIAVPGTSSFVGEYLLLLGIFTSNTYMCVLSAIGVILCGGYSLWLYNRMVFGNLKIDYIKFYNDIYITEFIILIPLILLVIYFGISATNIIF